jgi:hypothetical protein
MELHNSSLLPATSDAFCESVVTVVYETVVYTILDENQTSFLRQVFSLNLAANYPSAICAILHNHQGRGCSC